MMMYQSGFAEAATFLGVSMGTLITLVVLLSLWSLAWKGWALWIAAKNTHTVWFVLLLVLNTMGILEIIYIFAVGKPALKSKVEKK